MAKKINTEWRNRIVSSGTMPASQFVANPSNWRIHPKAQREALNGVLNEVGWVQNVIVNKTTGNVVDGHARIEEALKRGDDTPVPYVEVELTEDEEQKILLTLDPISAMAAADKANLDALLKSVETQDAAVMAMIADMADKAGLDYGDSKPLVNAEPQIDKAEELRVKWGVELGQLWQLGDHRLLCGDSTKKEDVERVMGGEKAELCVTDPPYNVGLDYGTGFDDSLSEGEYKQWSKNWMEQALIVSAKISFTPGSINLGMWLQPYKPTSIACWVKSGNTGGAHGAISKFQCWEPIVFIENRSMHHDRKHRFTKWLRETGVTASQINTATKSDMGGHYLSNASQPAIPSKDMWYKFRHLCGHVPDDIELLVSVRRDSGFGRERHSDVFDFSPTDGRESIHACAKPIALWADLVKHYSEFAGAVYDPFSGSGTTLIACEQLGRKCRAIEISPAYVALALQRWADATGKTPVLMTNENTPNTTH